MKEEFESNEQLMDSKSQDVIQVFEAIGQGIASLNEFANFLRRNPRLSSVTTAVDFQVRGDGNNGIFVYVDSEIDDGSGRSWNLDIRWDEKGWLITSLVSENRTGISEILEDFPDKIAQTTDELLSALAQAVSNLLNSQHSFDYQRETN